MTIADRIIAHVSKRPPDFIIGEPEAPYLLRWWILPRNPIFNVYMHKFLRSDEDRALHDHRYSNLSILLRGHYLEHTIAAGGINKRTRYEAGNWRLRLLGSMAHRIELIDNEPCWTLFFCGFRYREWGFHCADRGWVHWEDFTSPGKPGQIGKGCDQ